MTNLTSFEFTSLLLLSLCATIHGFYITKNIFTPSNADLYCRNYCKSRFGIINNNKEFEEIKEIIRYTPNYWSNNKNIWIGLSADSFPNFQWDDNTSLFDTNFGNNIAGGVYPWNSRQPNGAGKECVMMKSAANYLWSDSGCQTMKKSLCNNCDSVLNKYIISTNMSLPHQFECQSKLATSLANLYTQRDYNEAKTLCSAFGESCWINNINNTHCVELNKSSNFMINNVVCNSPNINTHYVLCNLPSELCTSLSNWTILNGDISFANCEMDVYEGDAVITDKQWYNSNGILVIDYMYSNEFNTSLYDDGDSGIIIYESICDFYYISVNGYNISILYGEQQQILVSVPLLFNSTEMEFLLSIQITNKTLFDISVNDIHHISYTHVNDVINTEINNSYYSGYIGIKSSSLMTTGKSLYVSGTVYQMNENEKLNLSQQCITTIAPTTTTTATTAQIGATLDTEIGLPSDSNNNQLIVIIKETNDENTKTDSKHVEEEWTTTRFVSLVTELNNSAQKTSHYLFHNWWYIVVGFGICCLLFCAFILMFLHKTKKMMQIFHETTLAKNIATTSPTSPTSPTSHAQTDVFDEMVEEVDKMEGNVFGKMYDNDFVIRTVGEVNHESNNISISLEILNDSSVIDAFHTKGMSEVYGDDFDDTTTKSDKPSITPPPHNSDQLIQQQQEAIECFNMNKDLEDQFNDLANNFDVSNDVNDISNMDNTKQQLEFKDYGVEYNEYIRNFNNLAVKHPET